MEDKIMELQTMIGEKEHKGVKDDTHFQLLLELGRTEWNTGEVELGKIFFQIIEKNPYLW